MKNKILKECMDIAIENNTPRHPQWFNYHHFSFIVQRNKIIKWGMNRGGSPQTYLGYSPRSKIHSEIDAYSKSRTFIDISLPFEVVNIRLTKTFMVRASGPCKCCWNFLERLGCKRIYFTTDIGYFARMEFDGGNPFKNDLSYISP